ncbi:hypothetical protein A3709_18975 [Halioglobus sp. HI00S01]|uniref:hypothetical protein n=1 Tax=Halioglobus sp. HI00S01 TaxID=1822214 RepID=UPI0007C3C2E2|nr:hypothetical protein [Halioglobus sp. HI00S01]KZX57708.1 hypothetical protein A3709_18975 [Halioglobus sp. HI00S01]
MAKAAYKKVHNFGPGGIGCPCCGPAPGRTRNAGFELFGAFAGLNNCRAVYRARMWAGVSPMSSVFFWLWGVWNLYFYGSLDQTFSMLASVALVGTNSIYLYLLWRYRHVEKPIEFPASRSLV